MVELVNIKPRTPLLGRVGLPCRSHLRCSLICPRFSACPVAISRELSTKRIFEKSQSHVHVRKRQTTAPAASTVSDAITLLQESPLRDAGAFVFSIVGAKVLIKIFDKMEETGIIDRVRLFYPSNFPTPLVNVCLVKKKMNAIHRPKIHGTLHP